jgi:hypothetical protein
LQVVDIEHLVDEARLAFGVTLCIFALGYQITLRPDQEIFIAFSRFELILSCQPTMDEGENVV